MTVESGQPPQFKTSFVAFLDVLGWREVMRSAEKDDAIRERALRAVADVAAVTRQRLDAPLETGATVGETLEARFSQFSDCMVLSGRNSLLGFLIEVSAICRGYLFHGFLVRGGIAFGGMYHDGSVAAGPALTDAYNLESTCALYPRVVLQPSWLAYEDPWGPLLEAKSGAMNEWADLRLIRSAPDGYVFVDYLQPLRGPMRSDTPDWDGPDMFLGPARQVIVQGLNKTRGLPAVFEKYRWMAEYFNDVLGENSDATMSPINWKHVHSE